MPYSQRKILHILVSVAAVVAYPAAAKGPEANATRDGHRIAAISGIHVPHQGFALSASVPSDRMCVELAQNLVSELGIVVHVVCTDPKGGGATIVAECGYADESDSRVVESFSPGWRHAPFLICVPTKPDLFRAQRIAPDLDSLRPKSSPPSSRFEYSP